MPRARVIVGDNRRVRLVSGSVAAIVTDPPSGKGYMRETWEISRGEAFADEIAAGLAVGEAALVPGGWAAIWAHPSTSHWTALGAARAGLPVMCKLIHANAEAKAPAPGLFAPGHEEWILCRKAGPKTPLSLALWAEATGRHPRTLLLSNGAARALDELVGVRRSGPYSGKRNPDKNRRSFGAFKGTLDGPSRGVSECAPSGFFPNPDTLALVYGSRARHSGRDLGPDGPRSEHTCPKNPRTMLPIVDLVTGCAPAGPVLDLWAGTGAIGEAACLLGLDYIGIELEPRWADEARLRLAPWLMFDPIRPEGRLLDPLGEPLSFEP